ncbi:MAG: hypothetical protein C0519_09770 [Hyphomicrobium sp.]|nr:hypothetical protein [Hyphomicrobium sp.]
MTDRPKLIPALICGQLAAFGGTKAGFTIGSLFGPVGAMLGGFIGGFGAELYAMSCSFHSKQPYTDAGKAVLSLGIQMLPDTTTDLTVLTEPLPDLSGLPEASPLPEPLLEPAPLRRASLLERIEAASQARAAS